MMLKENELDILLFRSKYLKQKDYWMKKLSGEFDVTDILEGSKDRTRLGNSGIIDIPFQHEPGKKILKLCKNSNLSVYIFLLSALKALIFRYTFNEDVICISPINKNKMGIIQETMGCLLFIRDLVKGNLTFKELVLAVRKSVVEAYENQDYPHEKLLEYLFPASASSSPGEDGRGQISNILCSLANLHRDSDVEKAHVGLSFRFFLTGERIHGHLFYDNGTCKESKAVQISNHFVNLAARVVEDVNVKISDIVFLTESEKKQLLVNFSSNKADFYQEKTVSQVIEEQAEKTPDSIALVGATLSSTPSSTPDWQQHITYRELNRRVNRTVGTLRDRGVKNDQTVGILMDRSPRMLESILAVWKAGGAYIPLDPDSPLDRVSYMLEESQTSIVLTEKKVMTRFSLTGLHGYHLLAHNIHVTGIRPPIPDLDNLPIPDRSMVNYEKYNRYIGLASVKDSMSLQATRGCPYHCAYCHKIWPKSHVFRSAENILDEVRFYYNIGVRRFAFIDDIFNLNRKNSERFFQLIIEKGLKVQFFFPNGVRGDLLSREYIDLMIQAGTVSMALALETASPRLQKLIGKNLNLEKLSENIQYICQKYPHVNLELFTMHGFPTETEEEAMMTLEFIKRHKWIHFPYVEILKIYHNSDMERLALEHGISRGAILRSESLAFHELPETLPFDRTFTLKYQADFLNTYFLSKERLLHVLPHQIKLFTEDEIVQKYNSYLPIKINNFNDFLEFVGIGSDELGTCKFLDDDCMYIPDLNKKLRECSPPKGTDENALKVLLMDLSQFFSNDRDILYDVVDPPLGLMYLMASLNQQWGRKINGKITKSRIDFDNYAELKALLEEFKPDVIGIRTLTFYKDFFHKTIEIIRQWGIDAPIITGGPYATSSYRECLQDRNIDLAVLGEGEVTFGKLIEGIMENNYRLPGYETLKEISGIAFVPEEAKKQREFRVRRQIVILDELSDLLYQKSVKNPVQVSQPTDLAYIIFTSGSTGKPKGAMVEHVGMMNHIHAKINDLQITRRSIVAQNAFSTFDISVWQFFTALMQGGKTIIYPDELVFDPDQFISRVISHQVTVLEVVPSYLSVMLEFLESGLRSFKFLEYLLVTGEMVKPHLVERWFQKYPGVKMVNAYGPTEASDDITHFVMDKAYNGNSIPIGTPVQNLNIYIVDEYMNLCPISVKGEICVSGVGVGRGYLNNDEQTREAFTTDPFIGIEGVRLYKTGDLGRWLPDGTIEFFGRKDNQVKIRGFRIELGEIESHLAGHPNIKETVVIVKEDPGADNDGDMGGKAYLCAFLVPREGLDVSMVREYLLERLPDYMVPEIFVKLENMPLTPNGKIDRKTLSRMDVTILTKEEYAAPRNEVEEKLTGIWSKILRLEKEIIGIDSNFFELGGHSLKATGLVAKIHKELNVKLPLVEVFKAPTIRKISKVISGLVEEKHTAIKPTEKQEYYVLSSAQRRLYVLQQMEAGNTSYNVPYLFSLREEIDGENLETIFKNLISRHESLRTSFKMIGNKSVQEIHEDVEFQVSYFLSGREGEIENIIRDFIRPFDLSQAPLLRSGLIKVENDWDVLMIDMHHIVTDGMSQTILTKEFMSLYAGEKLPPLKVQYRDYSEWQYRQVAERAFKQQEEYWVQQFSGNIPVLELPTDFPRPVIQSFEGSKQQFEITGMETRILKTYAIDEGASLYMVLMAIFYIFLFKLSDHEDIVVGTPIAGRRHVDLEQIIGMFINTLVLRNYPSGNKTFKEFLKEVKKRTLEAFENQDYQFEDLVEKVDVERNISRNPLFDVMFILQNMFDPSGKAGETGEKNLKMKSYPYKHKISKFDLSLITVEMGDKLYFVFEYCTKLFRKETIEGFIKYFKKIISLIIENPGKKISEIEIISEEEKNQVLINFNETTTRYPWDKAIHQLFEEQVERTPDHTALVAQSVGRRAQSEKEKRPGRRTERCAITYRELNKKSNQLAAILKEKGIKPDAVVGIMVERSIEMVVGILSILKAGGAYLPIDPGFPGERIKFMTADSAAKILITMEHLSHDAFFDKDTILLPLHPSTSLLSPLPAIRSPRPSELAYMIYTSGTTGKPKGVMIEHHSFNNFVKGMTDIMDFNLRDSILSLTTISFDIFALEVLLPLIKGSRVLMGSREEQLDPEAAAAAMSKEGVSILQITPSRLSLLISHKKSPPCLKGLKYLIVGGEPLPEELLKKILKIREGKIFNVYGPTETTIWSTVKEVSKGKSLNIGKPIANTRVYILDRNKKPQPIGVPGELYISGAGVARGYLNRPELTMKKFIPAEQVKLSWTKSSITNERLYHTGDFARWIHDGNIQFIGRKDDQVKIRGFRIEMKEIESRLVNHTDIKEAIVLGKETEPGNKFLVAYIVPEVNVENAPQDMELKEHLSKTLPDYMIPSYFFQVKEIPLTPNGKANRKALEALGIRLISRYTYVPPGNEIERQIVDTWKEVLHLDKVGIHDNYFDLGGTSFEIIRINTKLKELFQIDIPIVNMFRYTTVYSLGQFLNSGDIGIREWSEEFKRGKRDRMKRLQKRRGVNKNG